MLFAILLLIQDKPAGVEISEPSEGAVIAAPAMTMKEILAGGIVGRLAGKAAIEGVVRSGTIQRPLAADGTFQFELSLGGKPGAIPVAKGKNTVTIEIVQGGKVVASARRTFDVGESEAAPKAEGAPKRGTIPKFKQSVLFDTAEADSIMANVQVLPKDNAWNEDISKRPVHPNSDKMIAGIGRDKSIRLNRDMGYVIVPPTQPKIDVKITRYAGESDKGPYPMPDNAPIEGWPMSGGKLEDIQRTGGGDRHVIVVDPFNGFLYEFYQGRKTDAGWEAAGEATFNLNSNALRPKGWTSSDAAGLAIFPSIPRFDECERGMVEHALRFTVRRTRKHFIPPATHHAGSTDDPTVPSMGQRFRLKASVDVSNFPKHAQAIALALKKYGMFVADNGGDWDISTPPDRRLQGLEALTKLKGSDFEVVQTE